MNNWTKAKFDYWHSKGLGTRAANALAIAGCANEADVRCLDPVQLLRQYNCSHKTVAEIGRVLFNEDWTKPKLNYYSDKILIGALESRGYKVSR